MNTPEQNYKELQELALNEGMPLFGVADIAPARDRFLLPEPLRARMRAGISIGYRLAGAVLSTIEGAPNQFYYFHYQRPTSCLTAPRSS